MATRNDGDPASGVSQDGLVERIRGVVGEVAGSAHADGLEVTEFAGQHAVRLDPASALEVLRALRDDSELAFDMLTDVTCVHFPRRPRPLGEFDVVYHLTSIARGHRIRLKVACPDAEAGVDSATAVWKSANWLEREAYDMFGVRFRGHPDLRRILMPEEYEGWPLRKEFPWRGH